MGHMMPAYESTFQKMGRMRSIVAAVPVPSATLAPPNRPLLPLPQTFSYIYRCGPERPVTSCCSHAVQSAMMVIFYALVQMPVPYFSKAGVAAQAFVFGLNQTVIGRSMQST